MCLSEQNHFGDDQYDYDNGVKSARKDGKIPFHSVFHHLGFVGTLRKPTYTFLASTEVTVFIMRFLFSTNVCSICSKCLFVMGGRRWRQVCWLGTLMQIWYYAHWNLGVMCLLCIYVSCGKWLKVESKYSEKEKRKFGWWRWWLLYPELGLKRCGQLKQYAYILKQILIFPCTRKVADYPNTFVVFSNKFTCFHICLMINDVDIFFVRV